MNAPLDLHALAACLARPVRREWLSVALAEGALLLAALRKCADASEAIAAASDARATLRRAVAA